MHQTACPFIFKANLRSRSILKIKIYLCFLYYFFWHWKLLASWYSAAVSWLEGCYCSLLALDKCTKAAFCCGLLDDDSSKRIDTSQKIEYKNDHRQKLDYWFHGSFSTNWRWTSTNGLFVYHSTPPSTVQLFKEFLIFLASRMVVCFAHKFSKQNFETSKKIFRICTVASLPHMAKLSPTSFTNKNEKICKVRLLWQNWSLPWKHAKGELEGENVVCFFSFWPKEWCLESLF